MGLDLFDYVLINRRPISPAVAAKYARQGSLPIQPSREALLGPCTGVVERDLAAEGTQGTLRHCPAELASAILELTRAGRPATLPALAGHPVLATTGF